MKVNVLLLLLSVLTVSVIPACGSNESTRKERRAINKGNELYKDRKFLEAQTAYQHALDENVNSAEARYNLGLSQVRQIANPADTTARTQQLLDQARKNFADVAALAKTKPGLAAKANFNLGNIEFNSKEFAKAIEFYKQSLRIDPSDDRARKNLRIAQKNLQKQNQDKNQNQDQNQDKNKDKDKQDQNQDNNRNQEQEQQKQQEKNLSSQAASQILQAIDNKESSTRARVNKANTGEKAHGNKRNSRRW